MTMRAAFVGFTQARIRRIVGALEAAGSPRLEIEGAGGAGAAGGSVPPEIAFVNAELGPRELAQTVEGIRLGSARMPVVLVYGAEPAGRLFSLARRYDCWLFSDADRLERGLNAGEVAEAMAERLEARQMRSCLRQVAASSGPCSTGD
jgi:hypothetical protein